MREQTTFLCLIENVEYSNDLTLGSATFSTQKFRKFVEFWVDSRKFDKAKILLWLIRKSLGSRFFSKICILCTLNFWRVTPFLSNHLII